MTDAAAALSRAALTGTLFYQLGAVGAQRVPAPQGEVAASLVRERTPGDRTAISGVAQWMAARDREVAQEYGRRGAPAEGPAVEREVRRALAAELGDRGPLVPTYGPSGADDRRARSPYAGSADAALLDFAAARARRSGAEELPLPDGGFAARRGWDTASISGTALRMLQLYGEAALAAKAA